MAEANEAQPNESAAPSPRRPPRKHAINLCCAQSVQVVVEEVARNLEGLGFAVTVICGAEARAALLGSSAHGDQPTIHVVCVQGSLQERVLNPLRQALATHGGPNHHLFVAVLDLGIPLAMVGQIRRFAEALERPPPPHAVASGTAVERRAWREHTQRELNHSTRSRSSMQVVERPGSTPADDSGDTPRPRPRPLSRRGRAAKISGTSKYRAVSASHGVVPPSESGVHKRRRTSSRLSPAVQERAHTPSKRVLGLPEHDARRTQPPPPPPPGEMARRRSSTTISAVSSTPPPPPKGKLPTSTSTPAAAPSASPSLENAVTTHHQPWKDGKPPAEQGAPEPEPDRVRPRNAAFRFTPPGVKAAEVRAKTGPVMAVPAATLLSDPDRTMVQGMIEEVPRTASTLRLDEPPFPAHSGEQTVVFDTNQQPTEPTEPTVVGPAPHDARPSDEITAPAPKPELPTRGNTVIGPPPAPPIPTPPVNEEQDAPPKRKTVLYMEDEPSGSPTEGDVSESAKTLLREDGGFEHASTLKRKIEQARGTTAPEADTARAVVALESEDKGDQGEAGRSDPPKRTVLYSNDFSQKEDSKAVHAASLAQSAAQDAIELARSNRRARSAKPEPEPEPEPDVWVIEPPEPEPEAPKPETPKPETPKSEAPKSQAPTPERKAPSSRAAKGLRSRAEPAQRPAGRQAPFEPTPEPKRSGRGWLWVLLLLLLGGGGFAAYQAGLLDGVIGRDDGSSTVASRDKPPAAPIAESQSSAEETASNPTAPNPAGGTTTGAEPAAASDESSASSTGSVPVTATSEAEAEGSSTGTLGTTADDAAGETGASEPEPAATTTGEPATDQTSTAEPEPAGDLPPDEQTLAEAADRREIIMLKTLFVSRRQGTSTTWAGSNLRCSTFEVDGVKGWRIPHRREMKLINAVLPLSAGLYWTKTVPKDDRQAAYMLDTSNGSLSLFLKQEPTGEVLCVRRRSRD